MEPIRVFASATKDRSIYRFHIGSYGDFLAFLKYNHVTEDMFTTEHMPIHAALMIDAPIRPDRAPRDYQVPVIDYIVKPPSLWYVKDVVQDRTKLVALATGRGKTASFLLAASAIATRVVMIIKPSYITKWVGDISNFLIVEPRDIMTVQGGDELKALINIAKEGNLTAKFIIISNRTFQNFIRDYELDPSKAGLKRIGYNCEPEEFMGLMEAGVRFIDEVHQDSHFNFKLDLYTNVEMSVDLSATFLNNDPFIEQMYALMHPKNNRYKEENVNKYIHAFAVTYSLRQGLLLRHKDHGSSTYSHNVFEQSVLKQHHIQRDYFNMIHQLIEAGYSMDYQVGDRAAVFVASIAMATKLTAFLQKVYPHLHVTRYVEDDPYENLLDSDIRVTTIQSGGTAHDISMLTSVILTQAVNSIVANKQTRGRLREIPGRTVRFYYLTCTNIQTHLNYHHQKKQDLLGTCATFKEINYPKQIG